MSKFLTRPESAEYLRGKGLPITWQTLQKLACVGGGPQYRIFGNKALSTAEELDAWVESKLGAPRNSASEAAE